MALDQKRAIFPKDLKTYNGPLYIHNNSNTKISFDDFKGNVMSLEPKGREGSFDLLAREVAENVNFQKCWRNGLVSVFPEEAADDELSAQEQRIRASLEEQNKNTDYDLEEPTSNKILNEFDCLEKGCNTKVFLSQSDLKSNRRPPLCPNHEHMSSMYSFTIEQDENGSKMEKWTPIAIVETQRDIPV